MCEKGEQDLPSELNLHVPEELKTHELYEMLIEKKIREFEKIVKGLEEAKESDASLIYKNKKLLNEIKQLIRRD